jgi:hypothetical protein
MKCIWIFVAVTLVSAHAETVFRTGPEKVSLLELYTSEGCSSCPPAESWLSQLNSDGRLWKEIVPVAFHVDYWDDLEWKDRFARREYTSRQQSYSIAGGISSVYTPGFVLNGQEWKGWFVGDSLPVSAEHAAGTLEIRVMDGTAKIIFSVASGEKELDVHVVPLAMNVSSEVRAGENRGHRLTHSFVALSLVSVRLTGSDDKFAAEVPLNISGAAALAVWVTPAGSLKPLQAAGGFLR